MEAQIKGCYLNETGLVPVDLFGYATNGLPGVEIIGLGQKGRSIKEKFIYLGRQKGKRFPLKRYVLCAELKNLPREKNQSHWDWLELPLLLIFWHLARHLPVHNLNDLVAGGKVSPEGKISLLEIPLTVMKEVLEEGRVKGIHHLKYLTLSPHHEEKREAKDLYGLPLPGLLGSVPGLYFETIVPPSKK